MTSASTYSEEDRAAEREAGASEAPAFDDHAAYAVANLPVRAVPELDEIGIAHGQPHQGDEAVIIVSQLALRQIAAHSESNLDCEVGGAMLGRAFRNNGQTFVEVHAAIPAVTDDHGPVHFTFTADAWSQLHKDRAERYPDLDIVGWFHTHPDLGVFYSSDDVVVHSAAFTLPWHVGMVVDPVRKETALFGWRGRQLWPTAGFYELRDVQPYSLLPWKLVQTAVWDHPYEHSEQEFYDSRESSVFLPPSNNINLPGLRYFGLGMGILGLLLSFFLLVGLVLPLSREVDRLQNMVIVLADTALADSNGAYCPDPDLRILAPITGVRATVGSAIEVMGTAMLANAAGYQINMRPAESTSWVLVGERSRGTKLGQLATWDTESAAAGDYELRLTAVDSNNIRIAGSPPCSIAIELVP